MIAYLPLRLPLQTPHIACCGSFNQGFVARLRFFLDVCLSLMYDLDMPSLPPKVIDGNTYYYARYSQRVGGKPKIARQVYLGKIEDLVAASEASRQPPQPRETDVAAF